MNPSCRSWFDYRRLKAGGSNVGLRPNDAVNFPLARRHAAIGALRGLVVGSSAMALGASRLCVGSARVDLDLPRLARFDSDEVLRLYRLIGADVREDELLHLGFVGRDEDDFPRKEETAIKVN